MFFIKGVLIIGTHIEIISVVLIRRTSHTDIGRIFKGGIPIHIIIGGIFSQPCPDSRYYNFRQNRTSSLLPKVLPTPDLQPIDYKRYDI